MRRWARAGQWYRLLLPLALLASCTAGRVPQLAPGYYQLTHTAVPTLAAAAGAAPQRRLYLEQPTPDSLVFYPAGPAPGRPLRYGLADFEGLKLRHGEFDFDIFTLPFKLREAREGVPTQLNTTFNAALYLGRRLDRYHFRRTTLPTGRSAAQIQTAGFGYGGFVGLGSTIVTADLTHQHAITDYEGAVLHGGVAAIYDIRALNVGAALGFDYLLGDDGAHWLYQGRPWLGVLFGLNLN
jgi:hypothetical protein